MFFFRLLGHHFAKILLFGANKTAHLASTRSTHLVSANGIPRPQISCISLPRTPAPQAPYFHLVTNNS